MHVLTLIWKRLVTPLWSFRCMAVVGILLPFMVAANDALCALPSDQLNSDPSASDQTKVDQQVIEHLRSGDVGKALAALGHFGEQTPTMSVQGRGGYFIACGAVFRALSQLTSEEQFELLKTWSLPPEGMPRIRLLSAIVPQSAPPVEFARLLGERPRKGSFSVAAVGDVRGLFCTGAILASAAQDCGRLKSLIANVQSLVDKGVPRADLLLVLLQIEDARADLGRATEKLNARIKHTETEQAAAVISSDDLALAVAALRNANLSPLGERLLEVLLATTGDQTSPIVRPFLLRAHTVAVLRNGGNSETHSILKPMFHHWVSAAGSSRNDQEADLGEPIWLTQEQQVVHLCGPGGDTLYLKYPLLGDFHAHLETQTVGLVGTDGGFAFDGVTFQALASKEFHVSNVDGRSIQRIPCDFVNRGVGSVVNRLSITSTPIDVTVAVNQHPYWKAKGQSSNPWWGLHSPGERRPLFRNLKVTGRPVIPREVSLVTQNDLHGWRMRSSDPAAKQVENNRLWHVDHNVVHFNRPDHVSETARVEQTLVYDRPLVDGDTVRYEFFYQPGKGGDAGVMLGRIAFLWHTDGIRLHWITSGKNDWTTLPEDNSIVEPLNRRGPKPMPLKVNAWNRAALSLTGQTITLKLNEETVYQRQIDWIGDTRFGVYRTNPVTGAQIRNVYLSGNWPESLPEQFAVDPFAFAVPVPRSVRHALNRLIGESRLADNVLALRNHVASKAVTDRFEELSTWIFPGESHPGLRVVGAFSPTRPPVNGLADVDDPSGLGGRIVSPVFDWLDAARELGRVEDCKERVKLHVASDDSLQQRARLALLILLALENREQPSTADFESFYGLVKKYVPIGIEDQWPELLVAERLVRKSIDPVLTRDFVSLLHSQRTVRNLPPEGHLWHAHVTSLLGKVRARATDSNTVSKGGKLLAKNWMPAMVARAESNGTGYPNAEWMTHGKQASKVSGHENDLLFFQLPLSGDFAVECDVLRPTEEPAYLMIGGKFAGINDSLKSLEIGSLGSPIMQHVVNPPLTHVGNSMHYRGEIRDNVRTISLNGRVLHSEMLPKNRDPWVAIRSWGRQLSRVEDLCILGNPTVLDAVSLSGMTDLTGWTDYHADASIGDMENWKHVDDVESGGMIVGRANPEMDGKFEESLLRYQRPLVENGTIEYEFFYQPEKFETHPALDRLVFMFRPEGIQEHWVTDGRFERSDPSADNQMTVVGNRRGPEKMPLIPESWNRVKMTLVDQAVQIELNGELVYERQLEATNQRTIGLFHYLGHCEVRVRHMTLRGDWPMAVPRVENQELAKSLTSSLDNDLQRLTANFTHDFAKDGVPRKYFRSPPVSKGVSISTEADGLHVSQTNLSGWLVTEHSARFSLSGDFDVQAVFEKGFFRDTKVHTGIMLKIVLDGPDQPFLQFYRMVDELKRHISQTAVSLMLPDKNRLWQAKDTACCASAGCLRIARRGDRVYYLFADENSDHFQLFNEEVVSRADVFPESIILVAYCHDAGSTDVVWKKISMRAERMTWFPDTSEPPPTTLSLLSADGAEFKTVMMPKTHGFASVGSPRWSADGRKIGVDLSSGRTTDSRIFVIDVDTSEVKDLGAGCMPSFSKDGTQVAFSCPGRGIMTMNIDGTDRQIVDAQGWGTEWSPDGSRIAYGKAGNVTLYDVATRQSKPLLAADSAKRYSYMYWNLCWSHDSKLIAFKARSRTTGKDEFAVADVDNPAEIKVLSEDAASFNVAIGWTPNNQEIVVTKESNPGQGPRLHTISRLDPGPPKYLKIQRPDEKAFSFSWSRDGKWIAVAGQRQLGPVPWTSAPVSPQTQQ